MAQVIHKTVAICHLKEGDVFLHNGRTFVFVEQDSFLNVLGYHFKQCEMCGDVDNHFEECGIFAICLDDGKFCEFINDQQVVKMNQISVQ